MSSSWTCCPCADEPPPERSDAARNREALLRAAEELIDHCGIQGVTMDAVAAKAGVGKGTVFRRFYSREGLMGSLLNRSETEWQGQRHLRSATARVPGLRRWTVYSRSGTRGWSSTSSTPG